MKLDQALRMCADYGSEERNSVGFEVNAPALTAFVIEQADEIARLRSVCREAADEVAGLRGTFVPKSKYPRTHEKVTALVGMLADAGKEATDGQ